jgi:NAD(P)-dependent dehydrogenase (short-subunit alcohol dehydrogenase family)
VLANSSRPLAGKVVLVTGAGTGIGKAAAIAFAKLGASLSLCGRRTDPLRVAADDARAHGVVVQTAAVDVGDEASVQRWVADAKALLGRIDVLANCAGTNTPKRSWAEVSTESWHELITTNLSGVYFCCQAVLPTMRDQQDGLIINVSSMAGIQASVVSGVAYSASKFGVVALTQSLNVEEWRNGIRATVVCPGDVATPIMEKRPSPPPPHARPQMLQPEDLGATLAFLATLPPRALVEQVLIRPRVRQY